MTLAAPRETRDYTKEMRAIVEKAMSNGGLAGVAAHEIVARLQKEDPDLIAGFFRANAVTFLREFIGSVNRVVRTRTRMRAAKSVFADAAREAEAGDAAALAPFLAVQYVVDPRHTRKLLMDMTRDELLFAAGDYDAAAARNKMEGAFLRAVSKKVGNGVVADHFTPQELAAMRNSIGCS